MNGDPKTPHGEGIEKGMNDEAGDETVRSLVEIAEAKGEEK